MKNKFTTVEITMMAVFAAILCVSAYLSIPTPLLRLAVYEIKFDEDIPVKVAINEAVELAKTYCDVEAKSFINALLAKLAD